MNQTTTHVSPSSSATSPSARGDRAPRVAIVSASWHADLVGRCREAAQRELAAAVGIPDEMREEAIKALVVRRAGARLGEAELRAHCERELAEYKVPSEYDFVAELPKTAAGKVDKRAVKELVAR